MKMNNNLYTLVSGSSGNSTFVNYKSTNILVDCGMSGKSLEKHLNDLGVLPTDLNAILVTHEHIDHISGIGVVARRYNLPVYATEQTHLAMDLGKISDENLVIIEPDRPFEIGDIQVNAFNIPHDAAAPVGYRFFCGNKKVSVATDIGIMTSELFEGIAGSEEIVLEANHDIEMLVSGTYPERLKRRILSDFGHLANDASAKTVVNLVKRGTKKLMLAHLSTENNTPKLAYDTVNSALCEIGASNDVILKVANRYEVTSF